MNKEKIISTLTLINKYLLYLGIILISLGIGATYQASHDVKVLNETLYNVSVNKGILTDGISYYSIELYNTHLNFSANDLLNKSQCKALYGI